jgi:hypothetical protein
LIFGRLGWRAPDATEGPQQLGASLFRTLAAATFDLNFASWNNDVFASVSVPGTDRGSWSARSAPGERRSSRLVAAAAEDCLNIRCIPYTSFADRSSAETCSSAPDSLLWPQLVLAGRDYRREKKISARSLVRFDTAISQRGPPDPDSAGHPPQGPLFGLRRIEAESKAREQCLMHVACFLPRCAPLAEAKLRCFAQRCPKHHHCWGPNLTFCAAA